MSSRGIDKSKGEIPVVDIGPLMDESACPAERLKAGQMIVDACARQGVLFATGHGISKRQRQLALERAREFFVLPEEAKRRTPAVSGGFTRGYIGFGGESGSDMLECKEAFSYGFPWPEDSPRTNTLQGPNLWPDVELLGHRWREDMLDLFRRMVSASEAVTLGVSLGLGLEEDALTKLCREGDTISLMRLFHYYPYKNEDKKPQVRQDKDASKPPPPIGTPLSEASEAPQGECPPDSQPRKTGSSPHTDWGFLTCILQDAAGGLQFLDQHTGRWADVPCMEEALVVNCGDVLALLTRGRLTSPVHQVVTTSVERTSFVFFFYPNFHASLRPLVPPGDAAAFDPKMPAVSGAGEGVVPAPATPGGALKFNTLLDMADSHSLDSMPFGEYLAMKWGAVFRGS